MPFHDHPPVDVAIAELAEAQHAVFRLDQIVDLGLTASAVRHRATAGRLHRCYRGVYSLVPASLLGREGRWLAAVFAAGPGAVLSHRSAAALHGLRSYFGKYVDVTIPCRTSRRHRGVRIHRSLTLTAADVTVVSDVPCTTVARTLFDLAEMIGRRPLERAFDQADAEDVLNVFAVQDQIARNQSRAAAGKLRALLAEHYLGSTMTRSELEERFVLLCRHAGLLAPVVNELLWLPDEGPPIRVDFLFSESRVAVETDGYRTHRTRQQFELDRENDQRLTAHDWRPFRTTWRQLERKPEPVVARLVKIASG